MAISFAFAAPGRLAAFQTPLSSHFLRPCSVRSVWRSPLALPSLLSDFRKFGYLCFAVLFWAYCTFYTSAGDSRWHECGHSTAFKTKWMNDVLYNIASFMVHYALAWHAMAVIFDILFSGECHSCHSPRISCYQVLLVTVT